MLYLWNAKNKGIGHTNNFFIASADSQEAYKKGQEIAGKIKGFVLDSVEIVGVIHL